MHQLRDILLPEMIAGLDTDKLTVFLLSMKLIVCRALIRTVSIDIVALATLSIILVER